VSEETAHPADENVRAVIKVAIAGAVALAVVLGASWLVFGGRGGGDAPGSADTTTTVPGPGPRPDRRPPDYAWVDRGQGVVQIPIERAMERVVERYRAPSHPERQEAP